MSDLGLKEGEFWVSKPMRIECLEGFSSLILQGFAGDAWIVLQLPHILHAGQG